MCTWKEKLGCVFSLTSKLIKENVAVLALVIWLAGWLVGLSVGWWFSGVDLGGRGVGTPPPWDDLWFSNTTGILGKKKKRKRHHSATPFLSGAPPPKINPGSTPGSLFPLIVRRLGCRVGTSKAVDFLRYWVSVHCMNQALWSRS